MDTLVSSQMLGLGKWFATHPAFTVLSVSRNCRCVIVVVGGIVSVGVVGNHSHKLKAGECRTVILKLWDF
jgi:hypothetical protein